MRRYKKGTAKSGRGGKGGKVKSRKQAIAIGLSKARKKGKKVPKKSKKKSCSIELPPRRGGLMSAARKRQAWLATQY